MTPEPHPLPYPDCICTCNFIVNGECKYREMHAPTIAVDFDRVLFTHEKWEGHQRFGDPIPGAREAVIELQQEGFKIMIWTTRNQPDIISAACKKHGIPFDYINRNPNQPPEINPSKPVADYYIDDRAVHFTSWSDVLDEIRHREKHDPYYRVSHSSTTSAELVLDDVILLYELLGNRSHESGERGMSAVFYGVMSLLKQRKSDPDIVRREIAELQRGREPG